MSSAGDKSKRTLAPPKRGHRRRMPIGLKKSNPLDVALHAFLLMLAASAPLIWSFPELPTIDLHPMRLPSFLCLLIFAPSFALTFMRGKEVYPHTQYAINGWMNLSLCIFIMLCAASCVDSISPWESIVELVNIASFAIAFFAAVSLRASSITMLLLAISLGGYVESLVALREYALSYAGGLKDWRTFGTFQNPNLLGGHLAMCLPVMAAISIQAGRPSLKFAGAFVCAVCLAAFTVTGSKGAFLSFIVSAIAFAILALRCARVRGTTIAILGALSALTLLIIAATLPTLRQRLITAFSKQAHSWLFRIFVWQATLSMAIAHPFNGSGAGTFYLAYPRFTQVGPTYMAHNAFLQIAAECGMAALAAFLIFISTCLYYSVRSLANCGQDRRWLALGSICGCIAFMFHNLVDCTWYVPATRFTFALLLACSVLICGEAWCKTNANERRSDDLEASREPMALSIFNKINSAIHPIARIALLALCILVALSHVLGTYYSTLGRSSQNASVAIELLKRAATLEPLNARHRVALANCYLAIAVQEKRAKLNALNEALAAVRLQPMRAANYHTIARVYAAMGDYGKAAEAYEMALNVNPKDTLAMLELGQLLELKGDPDGAARMYEGIIQLMRSPYGQCRAIDAPIDVNAVVAAAKLTPIKLRHARMHELRQLKEDLELAIGIGESYLAFFQPQIGEHVMATRERVKRWLAISYVHLARVNAKLNNTSEAIRARRRAIELDPNAINDKNDGEVH